MTHTLKCLNIGLQVLFAFTPQLCASIAQPYIIYVIRHGETDWNKQGRVQGHTDIPLNEDGERQAIELRAKLAGINFAKVFSSDLSRAYRTAQLFLDSQDIEIIKVPHLRERNRGRWEGCLIHELTKHVKHIEYNSKVSKEEFISYQLDENLESFAQAYQRIQNLINSIVGSPIESPILFATHSGMMQSILYHMDFKHDARWRVGNGAYIKLQVTNDGHISIIETDALTLFPITND